MSSHVEMLPFDLPEPEPVPLCWYCGGAGPIESEHQVPISRGGHDGSNVVDACAHCNDLKGPLDLDEFRQGLGERLGLPAAAVVFFGEATSVRGATPHLRTVRSLGADRSVVRIDPSTGEELQRAWRYLTTSGRGRLTRRELASEAIARHLAGLRGALGLGGEWPEPNLTLFETEPRSLTGRNELSQLPRVAQARQHTKVPGDLLDWARAGVEARRAAGETDLTLVEWMEEAMTAQIRRDAERLPEYPSLPDALKQRYGPPLAD